MHRAGRRPRQGTRRARSDAGALAAMEAAFVGLVMISSVAVVASLESKPPSIPPSRGPLEDVVRDLLNGLEHISGSDRYTNHLDRAISEAVLGNPTTLKRYLDRTMPVGADCRFWLDNGKARRLLAGPAEDLARETVSASELWHPTWAYALVVPTLELISQFQPLDIQGFAVSQGALVKEAGAPVQVTMTTDTGTYTTAAVTGVRSAASPYLQLKNSTGGPSFVHLEDGSSGGASTRVHTDEGNASLVPSATFHVPSNQSTLSILGVFTGDSITYTLTLTAPNGTAYPYEVVGEGSVTLARTVTSSPGTWTAAAAGTILGVTRYANLTVDAIGMNRQVNLTLTVGESGNRGPIPVGTNLTIEFPTTLFDNFELTSTSQDGWRHINWSEDGRGPRITAELASPLQGASRDFVAKFWRPLPPDAIYKIRVELGNGTGLQAAFLLKTPGLTMSLDNPAKTGIHVTAPKPMAPGAPTTWGVAFGLASLTPLGIPERVRQLDIQSTDGTPLFASVQGLSPDGAWTLVAPGHVRWMGDLILQPNGVVSFAARVTPVATETATEPANALPVQFRHGHQFRLGEQARPYVFTGTIPPQGSGWGYEVPSPDPGSNPSQGSATLGVEAYLRALRVQGNSTYTVSPLGTISSLQEGLRLGMLRSALTIDKTQARVGEAVSITADFQGLRDRVNLTVADSGGTLISLDWRVDVDVIDPAQGFESNMSRWKPVLNESTTAGVGRATFVPAPDSFYGPHAVVAKASFRLHSVTLDADIVETARMLAVVDVLPDGGQSETALYWVSLECWLPDWQ